MPPAVKLDTRLVPKHSLPRWRKAGRGTRATLNCPVALTSTPIHPRQRRVQDGPSFHALRAARGAVEN